MSEKVIVEIVQPPANDGEKCGESDDEVENPPCTLSTKEAIAALETLIAYMEQHLELQRFSDYVDGAWALKRNIDVLNRQAIV